MERHEKFKCKHRRCLIGSPHSPLVGLSTCLYHTSLGDDLPSQSRQGPQPSRKQPSFLILTGVMMTQDSLFTLTSGLYKLPLCHFMPNPLAKIAYSHALIPNDWNSPKSFLKDCLFG